MQHCRNMPIDEVPHCCPAKGSPGVPLYENRQTPIRGGVALKMASRGLYSDFENSSKRALQGYCIVWYNCLAAMVGSGGDLS